MKVMRLMLLCVCVGSSLFARVTSDEILMALESRTRALYSKYDYNLFKARITPEDYKIWDDLTQTVVSYVKENGWGEPSLKEASEKLSSYKDQVLNGIKETYGNFFSPQTFGAKQTLIPKGTLETVKNFALLSREIGKMTKVIEEKNYTLEGKKKSQLVLKQLSRKLKDLADLAYQSVNQEYKQRRGRAFPYLKV